MKGDSTSVDSSPDSYYSTKYNGLARWLRVTGGYGMPEPCGLVEIVPYGQSLLRGFRTLLLATTAICAVLALPHAASAQSPSGGSVVAGIAGISQAGAVTNINQSSQKAIINWQGFSVGAQNTVNFNQPNSSAATLNRVIGNERSVIDGAVNANGQVFIVNSNGVLFGKGSQVNVGGLVASTLDISNNDFMAGNYKFSGTSSASVVNQGRIRAHGGGQGGGYVALLGKTVSNEGVIVAKLGTVAMASGEKIALNFGGDSLIDVTIDKGTLNALVQNKRAIIANGGQVFMTAKAADQVLSAQVNNSGVIQARTMAALKGGSNAGKVKIGKIKLLADGGTVNVSGKLDASAPKGGDGGFIETSGDHVKIADGAVVTTAALSGVTGTWLIDPTDFNIVAGNAAETTSGVGATTLAGILASTNFAVTTAAGGTENGDINVNAQVEWSANTTLTLNAANNININAPIIAHGASAGLVLNYGRDYNIRTLASYSGAVLDTNRAPNIDPNGTKASYGSVVLDASGQPIAKLDTSGGVYGSITFDNATDINGLTINGQTYSLIHDMAGLAAISGTGAHYALAQDLDATAWSTANAGAASVVASLDGTLAGLGHTVSELQITTNSLNSGLIGQTTVGSLVRDLGVVNVKIINPSTAIGNTTGALIGQNLGDVRWAYSTGNSSVSGGNGSTGGLIGRNGVNPSSVLPITTISDSFSTVAVSGTEVGGLIGRVQYGNIIRSHATGNITSTGSAGGLLGSSISTNISDAYATGAVTGRITGTAPNLSSTTASLGGLVGNLSGGDYLKNSFATGDVQGGWNLGGLVGSLSAGFAPYTVDNSYATGAVTSYRTSSSSVSTTGIGGLIGYVVGDNGGVFEIAVLNSHATGAVTYARTFGNNAGGLIGGISGKARIDNSYASGDVKGSPAANASGTGGLVGNGNWLDISNSHATGNVSGALSVGGLVGVMGSIHGTITNSNASGNVTGSGWNIGGLVGNGNGTTIAGSHATGNVTGTGVANANGGVGGFIGTTAGSITDSYATGVVTGPGATTGGFAGRSFAGASITNSFFNSDANPGLGIGSPSYSGAISGGGGLSGQQLVDIQFYANGTINQVLADRAANAAAAQQAAAARQALIRQGARTASAVTNNVQTSSVTPPDPSLSKAGALAAQSVQSAAVEESVKSFDDAAKADDKRQERERERRRTAQAGRHGRASGNGGGLGATIRSIDVNGQRFNLENGAPKQDAPVQAPQ